MTRIKRGVMTKKRHKSLISKTKGFRMMNNNVFSRAKNALAKAGTNAYIDRRAKKRTFRNLWTVRLNTAVRQHGLTYSTFIHALTQKNVKIDRKALSNLAIVHEATFKAIVDFVK